MIYTTRTMGADKILDYCWVCGARFLTANPPGNATEERHHTVPRAFGGANSPLVSLCDVCHKKVHILALSMERGVPDFEIIGNLPNDASDRLQSLSNIIVRAKRATMGDPNRMVNVMFRVNADEAAKVDKLKVALHLKSKKEVYTYAVNQIFSRFFK